MTRNPISVEEWLTVKEDARKARMYEDLLGFFLPPRPMTVTEFTEWWETERAPVIQAAGLTMEEAGSALGMASQREA